MSVRGNSGFIGLDRRTGTVSGDTKGIVNRKQHFLERTNDRFLPYPTLFKDTFEDNTLDKWNVANDSINYWVTGTDITSGGDITGGTGSTGTYAAYITNDGTNSKYTDTTTQHSHIYFDVIFPSNATSVILDFDWFCDGESSFDYGYITLGPTSVTPTHSNANGETRYGGGAGNRFNDGYKAAAATDWQHDTITFTSSDPDWCTNCQRRIVFSWVNDGSVGAGRPSFCINDVILKYTI
jgi:hypothetical protein